MPVLFKNNAFFEHSDDTAFDKIHEPGDIAPYSGIYRCIGCGKCETSIKGRPLPPQNHHQHTSQQGRIRWQLAASH
ncbi:MAG: protein L [Candidatus Acidiferrales bacterium]